MSLISVDLPAPFGPMSPMRSPRWMRMDKSRTIGDVRRSVLATFVSSATSLPERSPASSVSFTEPSRSRRAARSSRSASRRRTRPSLRVRRASTPLRIQTSSCAQNLSNLRFATSSAGELFGLPRLIRGEGAGIGAQQTAIELDDARHDAIEKARSCVMTISAGPFSNSSSSAVNAVDIEMVGRLIEQQQIRLQARARARAPRVCARRQRSFRAHVRPQRRVDAETRRAAPRGASVPGRHGLVEAAAPRAGFRAP